MRALLKKAKKPLLFVLALLPIAVVGGYFSGVCGWEGMTEELKRQVQAQIGDQLSLFYLSTTLQTVVYTVLCGFFGYLLSESIGLMKPFHFQKKPVLATLGTALGTGLLLCSDFFYFRHRIPQVGALYQGKPSFAYWMASVFYGGVIEEVLLRLFVMSLIAWIGWKLFFRGAAAPPVGVLIAANLIAALLFAAAHLPSTMQMFGEITPLILLRCFLLNGAAGVAFGLLYRKYGIQYAMIAHAGAHIVWKLIWIIML